MTSAIYTGHGAKTGGLQQHSVGSTYPFIVVGVETLAGLRWEITDATGRVWYQGIRTCALAHDMVGRLKQERAALADIARLRAQAPKTIKAILEQGGHHA